VLHDWAAIDPAAQGELPPALYRVALGLLGDRPPAATHRVLAQAALQGVS
jgi:hypothetical protein